MATTRKPKRNPPRPVSDDPPFDLETLSIDGLTDDDFRADIVPPSLPKDLSTKVSSIESVKPLITSIKAIESDYRSYLKGKTFAMIEERLDGGEVSTRELVNLYNALDRSDQSANQSQQGIGLLQILIAIKEAGMASSVIDVSRKPSTEGVVVHASENTHKV